MNKTTKQFELIQKYQKLVNLAETSNSAYTRAQALIALNKLSKRLK